MADVFTKQKRSEIMSRIRGNNTVPEKAVRKALLKLGHKLGGKKGLPGKPDLVIPAARTVVFVHGCFWHQHSGCARCSMPSTNKRYWRPKLEGNVARFGAVKLALRRAGWKVVVIWECQTKNPARLLKLMELKAPLNRINSMETETAVVFRLGELFCGPGGLALGAKMAEVSNQGKIWRIEHEWANDKDPDSCRTYARNLKPKNPLQVILGPVEKLDINNLPPIDGFAFGFPCNDYSIVGERKGFNGKFGPLYSYGVKIIDKLRPQWFVAENVSGLSNANSGEAFTKIVSDLENAGDGYNLTVHLYKFEDYGVPQKRHRIIMVGIKNSLGLSFKVPAPTTPGCPITAEQALTIPPIPADAANNERTKQGKLVIERLGKIPEGKNVWVKGLPEHLQLNVRGARLSQIYRRLRRDEPAYTITGSGGGGTHVYHWSEPRALTNRERARLQSFPDSYVFEGSKESARKQIGMAVPPVGAKIILEAILKTFAGVKYPSVAPKWMNGETVAEPAPQYETAAA